MDPYSYPDADPYQDVQYAPVSNFDEKNHSRAASVALTAAIIAALALIVAAILAWVLWSHVSSTTLLWFAIGALFALLFALFCAYYAWSASRSSSFGGSTPNALLSLIVFLGSLFLLGFFLISALFLWGYQCIHSAGLYPLQGTAEWAKDFGAKTIDAAAASDKTIFWWLVILSLIAALCFALIAYAAYSFMSNYLQTAKIALMVALAGITIFGFLMLFKVIANRDYYTFIGSYFNSLPNAMWFFIVLLAIILAAALVNAILSLFRWESAWFIMGTVWVILGLILIFSLGLLLRDLQKNTCGGSGNGISCKVAADLVSADKYAQFCPGGKYLPAGQTCRKVDLTTSWETNNQPAFLNPGCCGVASTLVVWPFFCIVALGLMTLFFIAMAAAANYAHTEYEKTQEDYFRRFNIVDVITIALVGLLGLGLLLYLLFGVNSNFSSRFSKQPPAGFAINPDGSLRPLPSFAPVQSAPVNGTETRSLGQNCYSLETSPVPVFTEAQCQNAKKCGLSVGLLASNAVFRVDNINGNVNFGPKSTKSYFFPSANEGGANNDYLHLYGNENEINQAIRNLVVCRKNLIDQHFVLAHAITTDISDGSNDALIGYNPLPAPNTTPGANIYADFAGASQCNGSCKAVISYPNSGKVNLVGNLLVKSPNGDLVPYSPVESGVELSYGTYSGSNFQTLSYGSYDQNGKFIVPVPYSASNNYVGVLRVTDQNKHYVDQQVDVLVTEPSEGSKNLCVGSIVLTTPSGAGCKSTNFNETVYCLISQKPQNYDLNVQVGNALSNQIVNEPLTYVLRRGYSSNGEIVAGPAEFNGGSLSASLPAGYYNLELSGANFGKKSEPILLDQARTGQISLYPKGEDIFNIHMDIDNTKDPSSDYDLNLKMKTLDGQECTVNSLNSVCPWARKVSDVGPNDRGIETIQVNKFINGTYMAYVSKGPAFGSCPQVVQLPPATAHLSTHNFGFQASNPLFNVFTSYQGKAFGGQGYSTGLGANGLNTCAANVNGTSWTELISGHNGTYGGLGSANFAFQPQTWVGDFKQDTPLKTGTVSNIPLIFTTYKMMYDSNPALYPIPPIETLWAVYGNTGANANLFLQSLPILYPNQKQDIEAWITSMKTNNLVDQQSLNGFLHGAEVLKANDYKFNQKSVNQYLGGMLELDLMNQNKIISEQSDVSSNFYDQIFSETQPTGQNGTLIVSDRDPFMYQPGIGEEPYAFNSSTEFGQGSAIVNDYETGLEALPATAPYSLMTTNGTAIAGSQAYVGVELGGQISVYNGNGTSPNAYTTNYNNTRYFDLTKKVPASSSTGHGIGNSASYFYSWIVPTTDQNILTYLQDQQGQLTIFFRNGSVLYTNVFNETLMKNVTETQNLKDGSVLLKYQDGTLMMTYPNKTSISQDAQGRWVRVMYPINSTTLLASIGQPAVTVTTSAFTTTSAVPEQTVYSGQQYLKDFEGKTLNRTGLNTFAAFESTGKIASTVPTVSSTSTMTNSINAGIIGGELKPDNKGVIQTLSQNIDATLNKVSANGAIPVAVVPTQTTIQVTPGSATNPTVQINIPSTTSTEVTPVDDRSWWQRLWGAAPSGVAKGTATISTTTQKIEGINQPNQIAISQKPQDITLQTGTAAASTPNVQLTLPSLSANGADIKKEAEILNSSADQASYSKWNPLNWFRSGQQKIEVAANQPAQVTIASALPSQSSQINTSTVQAAIPSVEVTAPSADIDFKKTAEILNSATNQASYSKWNPLNWFKSTSKSIQDNAQASTVGVNNAINDALSSLSNTVSATSAKPIDALNALASSSQELINQGGDAISNIADAAALSTPSISITRSLSKATLPQGRMLLATDDEVPVPPTVSEAAPSIELVAEPAVVTAEAPALLTAEAPQVADAPVVVEAPTVVAAAPEALVVAAAPAAVETPSAEQVVQVAPIQVTAQPASQSMTDLGATEFVSFFCFTGFGPKSIKPLKIVSGADIPIENCENMYPPGDAYWPGNLQVKS